MLWTPDLAKAHDTWQERRTAYYADMFIAHPELLDAVQKLHAARLGVGDYCGSCAKSVLLEAGLLDFAEPEPPC